MWVTTRWCHLLIGNQTKEISSETSKNESHHTLVTPIDWKLDVGRWRVELLTVPVTTRW